MLFRSKRIAEIEDQIDTLLALLTRGKIKPEHVERSIEPLEREKEDLEIKTQDLANMNEILNVKVEYFSAEAIRDQLAHFDEIISEDNMIKMRLMVRDFIHKIIIGPKDVPKARKWQRPVSIQGYIRALTMIKVASPRGFEPLSQA